ncbi:MAG: hypothetical protein ABI480_02935 [Chitinophagaceae bacterium]
MGSTFFKYILLFIFIGAGPAQKGSVTIEGKVVAESTGKPVYHAHVYVLDGEEEALTDVNGDFHIKSWQKIPLRLTAERQDAYQKASVVVSDPQVRQLIRLKNR